MDGQGQRRARQALAVMTEYRAALEYGDYDTAERIAVANPDLADEFALIDEETHCG